MSMSPSRPYTDEVNVNSVQEYKLKSSQTNYCPKWWVLVLWALVTGLCAEELPLDYPGGGEKVPEGVTASVVAPTEVIIGEEMPAKFIIKNTGSHPFKISTGGDYRATGYPQRLKVRVRDATGTAMPELTLYNYGIGGGGLCGEATIEPGQASEIEFPLEYYVSFPSAGTYTVIVGHDLGWAQDREKPHPLGVAKLVVKEPTPEKALALVESILSNKTPVRGRPVDSVARARLSLLRHAIYLDPLRQAATKGSVVSVTGIGHIATVEATESLLDLLNHANQEIQTEAFQQLQTRIPPKDAGSKSILQGWGDGFQIGPLSPSIWKAEFELKISTAATKLLSQSDPNLVRAGANVIATCGGPESAPAVIEALQKSLDTYRSENRNDASAMSEVALLTALDQLRKRGWRAPRPGRTAAMVAWFRQLADSSVPKPDGDDWKDDMLIWVTSRPPTLQENALLAIPLPLSEAAAKIVLEALGDKNPRVLAAACAVAQKSASPQFQRPLVQLVEIERVSQVHRAAVEAAMACGAKMELWRALVSNIVVQELFVEAIHALIRGTIDLPTMGGSSGNSNFSREQRFQIRDVWIEFLNQNEKLLLAGKKLPPPDQETAFKLTGANFPSGSGAVSYELNDGTRWPPVKAK